jgi:hypothetical protein
MDYKRLQVVAVNYLRFAIVQNGTLVYNTHHEAQKAARERSARGNADYHNPLARVRL